VLRLATPVAATVADGVAAAAVNRRSVRLTRRSRLAWVAAGAAAASVIAWALVYTGVGADSPAAVAPTVTKPVPAVIAPPVKTAEAPPAEPELPFTSASDLPQESSGAAASSADSSTSESATVKSSRSRARKPSQSAAVTKPAAPREKTLKSEPDLRRIGPMENDL
jgi:hypothetical protein